jgi:hypothetical protein
MIEVELPQYSRNVLHAPTPVPTDVLGSPIFTGMRVAYAISSNNRATLRVGTIERIVYTGSWQWNESERHTFKMLLRYDDDFKKNLSKRDAWVMFPENAVVLT